MVHGSDISFYENGNKNFEYSLTDGKRDGWILYYNDKGELFEGKYVDYDETGLLAREANCIKGKPEGECKTYSNGKVYTTAYYKNGKLQGDYNFYGSNGEIVKTWVYKKGKFIKEIKSKK